MSVRGQNEALGFLSKARRTETLLVMDFDGTLYRGTLPAWFKGISNADLGLILCFLHATAPRKGIRLVAACLRLWLLRRKLYSAYVAGEITLSSVERDLIEFFSLHILSASLPSRIQSAGRWVSRLCYGDARAVVSLLGDRIGGIVVISKAFSFVLDASVRRVTQGIERRVWCYGVPLLPGSTWRIDRDNAILSGEGKAVRIGAFLHKHPRFTQAIVIGDTEEDMALYEMAQSRLGDGNVLTVSIHAKDDRIRAASRCDLPSWESFGRLLKKVRGKPGDRALV